MDDPTLAGWVAGGWHAAPGTGLALAVGCDLPGETVKAWMYGFAITALSGVAAGWWMIAKHRTTLRE